MRYSEAVVNATPPKESKKEKPPVKAGTKEYDYNNLGDCRKLPTKDGFQ